MSNGKRDYSLNQPGGARDFMRRMDEAAAQRGVDTATPKIDWEFRGPSRPRHRGGRKSKGRR